MAQIIDFDGARLAPLLVRSITSFLNDRPDSDYQRGYLAALLWAYREGLGRGADDARIAAAEKMLRSAALSDLIAGDAHLIDTVGDSDGDDGA